MCEAIMFDNFLSFIYLREEARLNKENDRPPPYSSDPIIAKYRFCNVNRCHDRVTRWIFSNFIEKYDGHELLGLNLAVARFINWPDTLAEIGYMEKWNPERFRKVMRSRTDRGEKVYTGAYMIRAGTGEDAKLPKEDYLLKRVFNPLAANWAARPRVRNCGHWDVFLGSIFGMGDFMRNQIITDMKYSVILPRGYTDDWTTFILAGPGTKRGLNRLHSRDLAAPWKVADSSRALIKVRSEVRKKTSQFNEVFADLNNLSNCFCEWDKYRRAIEGQGKPRSLYRPDATPLP
jgi:hypothetical protein